MPARIIDLSEEPIRLSVRNRQLRLKRSDSHEISLPLTDVAVLVVSHPQVTCTQAVLSGLLTEGASVVFCNERHMPVGMSVPLVGHSTQTERMLAQARCSLPLRKRLWANIIKAKILHQAILLRETRGHDQGLLLLAKQVRSGDPENLESQAARRYWRSLFPGSDFRRDPDAPDQNMLLNYGYAVLRAVTARAICAAGLHPSLGLHHCNRYNPFCLADDLMEPFRPLIDRLVLQQVDGAEGHVPMDRHCREILLRGILGRSYFQGQRCTLFEVLSRISSSLADCYLSGKGRLEFPTEYGIEEPEDA